MGPALYFSRSKRLLNFTNQPSLDLGDLLIPRNHHPASLPYFFKLRLHAESRMVRRKHLDGDEILVSKAGKFQRGWRGHFAVRHIDRLLVRFHADPYRVPVTSQYFFHRFADCAQGSRHLFRLADLDLHTKALLHLDV